MQERSMRSIVRLFISESVVIAAGAALISNIYIFVLPRYFASQRTYSVLIVGLAIAAVLGAYVAHVTTRSRGWLLTLAISGIVTAATLLLSLLFISNTLGS